MRAWRRPHDQVCVMRAGNPSRRCARDFAVCKLSRVQFKGKSMRRFIVFCLALSFAISVVSAIHASPTSQPSSDVERIAAAAVPIDGDADLDHVLKAIGNARIVMIGEPWHGDGAAIALRARLVKRLHEKAGFDVLAFENDFFATHEAWAAVERGGDVRSSFKDEVWPFWIKTAVAAPLWDYIDSQARASRPLRVAGFDHQLSGRLSATGLARQLEPRLAALPGVSAAQARSAAATLHAALQGKPNSSTAAQYDELAALLARLERETADPFWRQVAESVRRNIEGDGRDAVMGDNLVWLATVQYPRNRIIVWAHNNHILANPKTFTTSPDPMVRASLQNLSPDQIVSITYTGAEVRRVLGPDMYTIATVSHTGAYSTDIPAALRRGPPDAPQADFSLRATLAAAPEGTVEAALAARGPGLQFVDLRPLPLTGPVRSRVLDYTTLPPVLLRLETGYDGLLFVRETYPLTGRQGGG